ncbi:MAG: hypothetical protein KAH25_03615 [Bacteroidales bacterium]|nr:hypothetical protein [Bacteroidales bacterium]
MKGKNGHIIIKSVALILASIFILLVANNVFFMHTHTLADGTLVQHAHPNNDSKGEKHSHTDAQYVFFQHLKILNLIAIWPLMAFYLVQLAVFVIHILLIEKHSQYQYFTGRAPPTNSFL